MQGFKRLFKTFVSYIYRLGGASKVLHMLKAKLQRTTKVQRKLIVE